MLFRTNFQTAVSNSLRYFPPRDPLRAGSGVCQGTEGIRTHLHVQAAATD